MIIKGAKKDEAQIINKVLNKFKNFEFVTNKFKSIEVIDGFCDAPPNQYLNEGKEICACTDTSNKTIIISNLNHICIYKKKYNIDLELNTVYEDMIVHEFGHLWFGYTVENNEVLRDSLLNFFEHLNLSDSKALLMETFIHEVYAVTFQTKLHSSERGFNEQLSNKILVETRKRFNEALSLMRANAGCYVTIDTVTGEFSLNKNDKMFKELCS